MTTIDIQKAQAFYAELALLQHSTAETNERFSHLSGFFYKLIKAATNNEKIAFRNFYGRFRYLLSQLKLTGAEGQNVDAFRRFIKEGNAKKITAKSIQQGISLLYRLIKTISGDSAPQIQSLEGLTHTAGYFLRLVPQRKNDTLTNLKVLCSSWTEITEDKGNPCFTLVGYDLENMEGQVEILIKALPRVDLIPVRQLLTKNAILQLHNIELTGKADNQYATTHESLITLEPDFLVDATSIGECFSSRESNSDIFFLSKILNDLPGSPALKGSMVGYYLDELVRNKEQDIETIYLTAQRNNALKAARFGKAEMQTLKESILKEHLKNIITLVETQTGKEIWIEPTYFSKEFGLQGRIDLLGINRDLGSKDIVELKSGGPSNPTQTIAWSNHKMQVVSYDMLLQSTYLFGHVEPTTEQAVTYHNEYLTENQNHVVQQALNANEYYLLQGPPGTGKTSTFLVNYIKEQTWKTKDKIVVLAFTNKAVEKICESFKPQHGKSSIDYIRLGSKHVNDENLFSEQLSDDNPDNWRKIIDSHQVIVSTVTTFQNNWLLLKEFISFKQVIIDEASQLTEAALAGILVLFDKFILIGDHKQLPSVVTQDATTCLTQSDFLHKLGVTDLRVSLFERLTRNAIAKGWKHAYGQLTHHYRMHQDIAALISQHYRETLITGKPKQTSKAAPYELPGDHPLFGLTKSRTVFIESAPETALKKNRKEAYIAAFIAQQLIDAGIVKPSQIGIVTPFRAQIAEIKKYIRTDILEDESFIVDTVERYQGDERKIILFSSTITNPRQIASMQSIAAGDENETDRKLLVSISRASEQFIILGNAEVLRTSKPYRELIAHIEARNGFLNKRFSENILSLTGELMAE